MGTHAKTRHNSAAALQLRRTELTHEEIARRLAAPREQVSRWLTGAIRPSQPWRKKICVVFGIDPCAWDKPVALALAQSAVAPPVADDLSVRQRALALRRDVETELNALKRDPHATPLAKLKGMASVASTLKVLGSITGEAQEIDEARIVRTPALRRMLERMTSVLCDDCGRAVANALEEWDG